MKLENERDRGHQKDTISTGSQNWNMSGTPVLEEFSYDSEALKLLQKFRRANNRFDPIHSVSPLQQDNPDNTIDDTLSFKSFSPNTTTATSSFAKASSQADSLTSASETKNRLVTEYKSLDRVIHELHGSQLSLNKFFGSSDIVLSFVTLGNLSTNATDEFGVYTDYPYLREIKLAYSRHPEETIEAVMLGRIWFNGDLTKWIVAMTQDGELFTLKAQKIDFLEFSLDHHIPTFLDSDDEFDEGGVCISDQDTWISADDPSNSDTDINEKYPLPVVKLPLKNLG